MGTSIHKDHLFTLIFADDQDFFAQDAYDVEFVLGRSYTEYQKWGVKKW